MDCKATEKKLIFYIENTLPKGESSVVQDHLSTCSACSQKLAYLQETLSYIETEKALTPKPFLYTRTIGRMQQQVVPEKLGRQMAEASSCCGCSPGRTVLWVLDGAVVCYATAPGSGYRVRSSVHLPRSTYGTGRGIVFRRHLLSNRYA